MQWSASLHYKDAMFTWILTRLPRRSLAFSDARRTRVPRGRGAVPPLEGRRPVALGHVRVVEPAFGVDAMGKILGLGSPPLRHHHTATAASNEIRFRQQPSSGGN